MGKSFKGIWCLSGILFAIGAGGSVAPPQPLGDVMCVELMLNAANLAFIAFSRTGATWGADLSFFVVTVAAAEVAIGLAIIVLLFRHGAADVDDVNELRG